MNDDSGYEGIALIPPRAAIPQSPDHGTREVSLRDEAIDQQDAIRLADLEIDSARSQSIPAGQRSILDRPREEEESHDESVRAALEADPPFGLAWIGPGAVWAIVL